MSTRHSPDPTESVRHKLRPLFDQVVIKELDQDRVRRSGLVVPPGSHEPPPQQGIVLAVGPGLDWWEHVGVEMPVQPGDHVVFPASAGVWVEVDEERLLVCRVTQLLGVLDLGRLFSGADSAETGVLNLLGLSNPLSRVPANHLVWGEVADWSSSYYLVWGNNIQSPSGQYLVWGNTDYTGSSYLVWGNTVVPPDGEPRR